MNNGFPRRQVVTWAPLGAGLSGAAVTAVAREPRRFQEVIAESGLEDWSVTWADVLVSIGKCVVFSWENDGFPTGKWWLIVVDVG